jgi:hypothetical protein
MVLDAGPAWNRNEPMYDSAESSRIGSLQGIFISIYLPEE